MKTTLTILFFLYSLFAFAKVIPVGREADVKSLRVAVQKAENGDTILLNGGIYKEGNIRIDKSIDLIGINGPVLDGENKYEILTVTGTKVQIRGIYFRNTGYSSMNDYAAIQVIDASFIVIEENVIERSCFGIKFSNVSYSIISNNSMSGSSESEQTSGNGVHLWKCENILVSGNDIQGHRDGIYFEFVSKSIIEGNHSHNNIRYGLHFMFSNQDAYYDNTFSNNGAGVAVMYSKQVVMAKNRFLNNWGSSAYGLLLKEISDGQIFDNTFEQNTAAIWMESTNRITVRNNRFSGNGWAMRIQASCNENTIEFNMFTGNTFDVATNGHTYLNRFSHNFWDKYEGYDRNKDGIGDIVFHPVSMYSIVVEQSPNAVLMLRSFIVALLDKAEKAIPSFTPEGLVDEKPLMKKYRDD